MLLSHHYRPLKWTQNTLENHQRRFFRSSHGTRRGKANVRPQTGTAHRSVDSALPPHRSRMDQINEASSNAHETFAVGQKQYRRVKSEFVTTKGSKPRADYSVPSSSDMNDEPITCKVRIETETPKYDLVQTPKGYLYELEVDSKLWNRVIGPKGATVAQIRLSTGCDVSIPQRGSSKATISISGSDQSSVLDAIQGVLNAAKGTDSGSKTASESKTDFDYFVSIPLQDARLAQEVNKFHSDVKDLIDQNKLSLSKLALMKATSLHFTLCMLHLHTEERRQAAMDLLQSLGERIRKLASNKPLEVDWSKVTTFSDVKDVSRVDVVYLEPGPKSSPLLMSIAELIREEFGKAGLTEYEGGKSDARKKLVLHATLINSRPKKFNLTPVQDLESARFSTIAAPEVHLSQRFHFEASGYYKCASKIDLM